MVRASHDEGARRVPRAEEVVPGFQGLFDRRPFIPSSLGDRKNESKGGGIALEKYLAGSALTFSYTQNIELPAQRGVDAFSSIVPLKDLFILGERNRVRRTPSLGS